MKQWGIFLGVVFCAVLAAGVISVVPLQASTANSSYESYVPNQVIVRYKPGSGAGSTTGGNTDTSPNKGQTAFAQAQSLQTAASAPSSDQATSIRNTEVQAGVTSMNRPLTTDTDYVVYTLKSGSGTLETALQAFSQNPYVASVSKNYYLHPQAAPNDPELSKLWGFTKIHMQAAWDKAKNHGSKSVKVAVIDSGMSNAHEDLGSNIIEYKNFDDTCTPNDVFYHGTHVAGTIGALGNNGKGVPGMNWEAGILALNTSCNGNISFDKAAAALNYAISQNVNVINLSLGCSTKDLTLKDGTKISGCTVDPTIETLIKQAATKGIAVVIAAGNYADIGGSANDTFPANVPEAITVAATGQSDEHAPYSNSGSVVDIAAPGGNPANASCNSGATDCILSTAQTNTYKLLGGTSQAAPHVTGLIALMLAQTPTLTLDRIEKILADTADDLGTPGKDNDFGAGRINAEKAIDAAINGGGGGTGATPTPGGAATPTTTANPNCPDLMTARRGGDYNCDGKVDEKDYTDWKTDFTGPGTELVFFEWWRRVFYK